METQSGLNTSVNFLSSVLFVFAVEPCTDPEAGDRLHHVHVQKEQRPPT